MKLLTPNAKINPRTIGLMVICQAVVFLTIWIFSPFVFLPKPGEVLSAFTQLWSEGMAVELITSFTLNIEAILTATAISLLFSWVGTLPFFAPVIALIGKMRFLSMVGLTFFFTIMTTSGHQLKLYMLVFSVTVFFVTGMADVIAQIPKEQYDLARVLKMGPWRSMFEVVILGQTDKAFDVLRQNAAIGWMMLSFTEGMSRSEGGIGAMLMTQNKYFHLSEIFAIQITIFALGMGQDYLLGWLKELVCPYASLTTERVPTHIQFGLLTRPHEQLTGG